MGQGVGASITQVRVSSIFIHPRSVGMQPVTVDTGGGNYDGGFGGGIYDSYSTGISVEDSTIVNNHAGQPSGSGFAWGGGISVYSTVLMKNSIIANNTAR